MSSILNYKRKQNSTLGRILGVCLLLILMGLLVVGLVLTTNYDPDRNPITELPMSDAVKAELAKGKQREADKAMVNNYNRITNADKELLNRGLEDMKKQLAERDLFSADMFEEVRQARCRLIAERIENLPNSLSMENRIRAVILIQSYIINQCHLEGFPMEKVMNYAN